MDVERSSTSASTSGRSSSEAAPPHDPGYEEPLIDARNRFEDHRRYKVNSRVNLLKKEQLRKLREEFEIPSSVEIRLPYKGELASCPEPGWVTIHPEYLDVGLRLPIQPYAKKMLLRLGVAPGQLNINAWRILIGLYSLWNLTKEGVDTVEPSFEELTHLYGFKEQAGSPGWYSFNTSHKRNGEPLIWDLPTSISGWKKKWFMARNCGLEIGIEGNRRVVQSVFASRVVTWNQQNIRDLNQESRRRIDRAWRFDFESRNIRYLLLNLVLESIDFVSEATDLRSKKEKKELERRGKAR